jgi:UPF0755 protein
MTRKKKHKKNNLPYILLLLVGVAVLLCTALLFAPNTGLQKKGSYLYIRTGATYGQVTEELENGGYINLPFTFAIVAKIAGLPEHVHAGKYLLRNGMSNFQMVRTLRTGRQTPVKLVVKKLRTKDDFVELVSANLEADSMQLRSLLTDADFLSQYKLDAATAMCGVLPNTYEFYWNTTAKNVMKKMMHNYVHFWNDSRKAAATQLGLTPATATVIASIVEEETNMAKDKPLIASVYLNRVKKNMKLQADPTVKFAIGDFSIKRITGKMLATDSKFNTYRYEGLPPGPICTPEPATIDAVLAAPATNYLYFCAAADFSGYSVFAATFTEQTKHAHEYQKELDRRGIK